jgi:hypothetical protein
MSSYHDHLDNPRVPGRRGRLPKLPPDQRLPIQYAHAYMKAPIPAPTYPVDVSGGITDWKMLGNDEFGDCTFAGREHLKMAKAAAVGTLASETWEGDQALIQEYLAYTHGADTGANIGLLLLSWWRAKKIRAFAPVDHRRRADCDSLMQTFHGLYAGVELTPDADALFGQGKPWTVADGQHPDPNEGHCIVKVGATGAGPGEFDAWVTWGALQHSTTAWTQACLDEAWIVVTDEDQADKLDMGKLLGDIRSLKGHARA